jgi:hypothetical protein
MVTITLNAALDPASGTDVIKAGPRLRCRAPPPYRPSQEPCVGVRTWNAGLDQERLESLD